MQIEKLLSPAPSSNIKPPTAFKPRRLPGEIVLFGDSLTQRSWQPGGLAQRLADAYVRKLDVVNRGLGGYQSTWGTRVLEQLLAQRNAPGTPSIELITIWFGANDAAPPGTGQHVPLHQFTLNLHRMIDMVRGPPTTPSSPSPSPSHNSALSDPTAPHTPQPYIPPPDHNAAPDPATRMLLLTPPPPAPQVWNLAHFPRQIALTRAYAAEVRAVGRQRGVPVVDVWAGLSVAAVGEAYVARFLVDGLHLNREGYELVYNMVVHAIREHYPDMLPERLPDAFGGK
ncbi:SGNH hydrolase [Coniophora puteana RWD-64-598 SS2]|uniref:SGNH hydrolase n=1 Tax=Coniophora puteana (strain RWD-64-598) TaxID=741705 RepID=A0A5M3MSB6_CONPW|nr:SGNH hydrolase [Coniophora puteana RWD-64-598 SS2]EIW81976.1 SGNH hydrolase [Coniophora puteana RWD-64-598 SS2]